MSIVGSSKQDSRPHLLTFFKAPDASLLAHSASANDIGFWRRHVREPLVKMMLAAEYEPSVVQSHTDLIDRFVLPALGPAPILDGAEWTFAFPSFMNDNHCPVELGYTWSHGRPSVRFSIEPIGQSNSGVDPATANLIAAERLCQTLAAAGLGRFDRLRELAAHMLPLNGTLAAHERRSLVFVAFDLSRCGKVMVKAYLMPQAMALDTSRDHLDIIDEAIERSGGSGLAWASIKAYVRSLSSVERPEAVILSTDCIDDATAFLKIYFRFRTVDPEQITRHLCLGNASNSLRWDAPIRQLWSAMLGTETDANCADVQAQLDKTCSLPTGGVLIYYDFSSRHDEPTAKVYLPVRHWSRDDAALARGMSQLLSVGTTQTPSLKNKYDDVVEQVAGIKLRGQRGLHNYVCLGQKKDGRLDLGVYLNPMPPSAIHSSLSPAG